MTGLPEWTKKLAGFDPARWYVPVVCTDRGGHAPELLALAFDHAEGRGLHFGGPGVHLSRMGPAVTLASTMRRTPQSRPGSLNFECPACARTPRVPRDTWSATLEAAEAADVPIVDVSLYGAS